MKFQEKGEGSFNKDFLKLKSGESVRGIFRGDPFEFRQHWVGQKSFVCNGEGCEYCKKGIKAVFRFRINFIVNENGAYTAKVFEQGWMVYDQLRSIHGDYNLEKTIIKITRQGSGTDTTYTILPLPPPNGVVTDTLETQLSKVTLHPLEITPKTSDDPHHEGPHPDDDVPF